jgi:hypothetical protein
MSETATVQIREVEAKTTKNGKAYELAKGSDGRTYKAWNNNLGQFKDQWVRLNYEESSWVGTSGKEFIDLVVQKVEGPVEAPDAADQPAVPPVPGTGEYIAARENPEKQRSIWASVALEQARAAYAPFPKDATPKQVHERVGVLAQAFFQVLETLAALPEPPKKEEKSAGGGGFVDEADIPFERTL